MLSGAILIAGCASTDARPFVAAVDKIAIPINWAASKLVSRGSGGTTDCVRVADALCPSATRYYIASGALPDVYQQARVAVIAAGFANVQDVAPSCDVVSNGPRCSFSATEGDVQLEVAVFGEGADPDGVGVGFPGEPTVRFTARRKVAGST